MDSLRVKQPICLDSLKVLSDYWTMCIVAELSDVDSLRFGELERNINGINTASLSKRLKDMQSEGLLSRIEHSRADVTYSLTDLGKEAVPLLEAVNRFSLAAKRLSDDKRTLS